MSEGLSDFEIRIMMHLKKARVDYAFSISRAIGSSVEAVENELEKLEEKGLVEKVFGRGLKRTKAKMKRSPEVTKHHTYYKLSRKGKEILRAIGKAK